MDKRIVVVTIVKDHSQYNSRCGGCTSFIEKGQHLFRDYLTNKGYRFVVIKFKTKSNSHFDFLDINEINFPKCLYGKIPWSPFVFAVTEKDYLLMERGSPLPDRILILGGILDGDIIKSVDHRNFKEWVKTLDMLIEIRQPIQYLRNRAITGKD
jgi:hypothetical protein